MHQGLGELEEGALCELEEAYERAEAQRDDKVHCAPPSSVEQSVSSLQEVQAMSVCRVSLQHAVSSVLKPVS